MKELTRKQCSYIAGGDPGMVLAAGGNGGGSGGVVCGNGGYSNADMLLANMGIASECGPMAIVTVTGSLVEVPSADHLRFDGQLSGSAGAAAGAATIALLGGIAEGAVLGAVAVASIPVIAGFVAVGVTYGVYRLLQADHNKGQIP